MEYVEYVQRELYMMKIKKIAFVQKEHLPTYRDSVKKSIANAILDPTSTV